MKWPTKCYEMLRNRLHKAEKPLKIKGFRGGGDSNQRPTDYESKRGWREVTEKAGDRGKIKNLEHGERTGNPQLGKMRTLGEKNANGAQTASMPK